MQLLATIAAFAAAVASVRAQSGQAHVYNHCSQDVYLWAVDVERNPSSATTVHAGSSWSEAYHSPSTGGVSVKISKANKQDVITQLEYTLTTGAYPFIWYDGSNINCVDTACPFSGDNLYLGATISTCPQVYCAAGNTTCGGFYNAPDQNEATNSCDPSADVFLHLCYQPGQKSSSAAAAPPPASSSPAPSSAKAAPVVMEAIATTFKVAARSPEPNPLAVHAHARRHLHHHAL